MRLGRRQLLALPLAACTRERRRAPAAPEAPASIRAPTPPAAPLPLRFDPARLQVCAVGVLRWRQGRVWPSFPAVDRRDAALLDALRARGVPDAQITFVADEHATRDGARAALDATLARCRPADRLWFYFAGHGARDDAGRASFIPPDATGDVAATGWNLAEIGTRVRDRFRGEAVSLFADCCASGALVREVLPVMRGPASALASSQANESSTGSWAFTDCLVDAVEGAARLDLDGDGAVSLRDLARYAEAELAFAAQQFVAFGVAGGERDDLALGAVSRPLRAGEGERVEVSWQRRWFAGRVVERGAEGVRAHYIGYPPSQDEDVPPSRVRAPRRETLSVGSRVRVQWRRRWYPATVIEVRLGVHRVHYDGYADTWDEWVPLDRLRAG